MHYLNLILDIINRYYSTHGTAIEQLDAVIRHIPSFHDEDNFILPFVGNGKVGSMVGYEQKSDSNIRIFYDSKDADLNHSKDANMDLVM